MTLKTFISSTLFVSSLFGLFSLNALAQVSVSGQVQIGTPPPAPPPQPMYPPPQPPPPSVVYAQPPPPQPYPAYNQPYYPPRGQDGIFIRAGLGAGGLVGSNRLQSTVIPGDFTFSGGGVALDLAVGGTILPGLVLGGEIMAQQAVRPVVTRTSTLEQYKLDTDNYFGLVGLFTEWYPRPHGGFHIGGLLGLSFFNRVDPVTGVQLAAAYGIGIGGNIGYVFRFSRNWGLDLSGRINVGGVYGNGRDAPVTDRYTLASFSLLASILYH